MEHFSPPDEPPRKVTRAKRRSRVRASLLALEVKGILFLHSLADKVPEPEGLLEHKRIGLVGEVKAAAPQILSSPHTLGFIALSLFVRSDLESLFAFEVPHPKGGLASGFNGEGLPMLYKPPVDTFHDDVLYGPNKAQAREWFRQRRESTSPPSSEQG